MTTSGSLGLLFAPALPLIVYAVVAQQLNLQPAIRIDDLFIAECTSDIAAKLM